MAVSSSASEQSFQQPRAAKSSGLKLSRAARFWLVLLMFVVFTIVAFNAPLNPDPYRSAAFPSLEWMLFPREQNAHRRLPEIQCDLNAIHALPGGEKLWAVGNRGLIVHSDDGGRSWMKQTLPSTTPTSTPATPTPTPRRPAGAKRAFFQIPNLLPVAHAAEEASPPSQTSSAGKGYDSKQSNSPLQYDPSEDERRKQQRIDDEKRKADAASKSSQSTTGASRGVNANRNSSSGRTDSPRQTTSGREPSTTNNYAAPQSNPAVTPTPQVSPQASATPEAPTVEEDLIAVHFTDERNGSVIGRSGTRFKTADGGKEWTIEYPLRAARAGRRFHSVGTIPNGSDEWAIDAEGTMHVNANPSLFNDGLPKINGAFFPDANRGWAVGEDGTILVASNIPKYFEVKWRRLPSDTSEDLFAVYFDDAVRGWATGAKGMLLRTTDGGQTWQRQASGTTTQLNSITFLPGGRRGWAAGNDGTILSTTDGGENWSHQTQESTINTANSASSGSPLRALPPWYYISLLGLALVLWPIRKPPPSADPPEESIADVLIADRPLNFGEPDPLNFTSIALGVSRFLRNDKTVPPLTIAVTGEWGTGKSSLMNLLRIDLMHYGFRPVWFNAWHHQKEEHLLASLLQNIKLQAIPQWWRPNGLKFRAKLIWIRGWRQRLPVLLLLLLLAFFIGYEMHNAEGGRGVAAEAVVFANDIAENIIQLNIKAIPSTLIGEGTLLALMVNLIGVLIAMWKGMTAFKVNPASLMASVSGGARIRDLTAQTSCRQNFATEFNDVTTALGARSMLLFIDDLDRCHPENVLEVLEAVNFLVASGDCFVVMGMARERVERCVGLSFKDVADEMAVDQHSSESLTTSHERAKQRRADFARQYLDKLINIEVPVPTPTGEQFGKLMVPEEVARRAEEQRAQEIMRAALTTARKYWPAVMVLCVLALGYAIGAFISSSKPTNTTNAPGDSARVVPATPQAANGASNALQIVNGDESVAASNKGASASTSATPAATPARKQIPQIVPPADASTPMLNWVVVAGTFLAAVALGFWALTRRADVVTKDSKDFADALKIWCPLVYARQKTPRSIKRFMNRVRYLAMRYRPAEEAACTPWQTLLYRVGSWFGAKPPEAAPIRQPREHIESVLVALSAIHHLNPTWIENESQWTAIANETLSVVGGSATDARTLVQQARDAHIEHFGHWGVT
ncbi:MAG: P-loop NTPase fold protein, partial [Acidobacteriota bacterium]|nr:P-loop NTPase fold protein [Acidobacteriota bacterium]